MAHTIQATPKVASWELVCCSLYSHKERTAMLGDPPLTKRSIDEVFLFRAIMGRLFKHIDDYDDLRSRLRSGGFSTNLVELKILPRTEAGVQEAYRRAKLAFQNNNYNDEVDQDKTNDPSNKKIKNVPFWDLLKISTNSIAKPFAPEIRLREDVTLYYSRGDLPQVIPPQWDGAPTDILDHDAIDNTVDHYESQNNPSETSVERISWERICRDLYNPKKRKAMLGYPPLSKRSIDEVFLFRALTGRIFESSNDCDDLWKRLILNGINVNLSALKTLHCTEAGFQEAYRRAKQAFQQDNYDDENEVDQGSINNHIYGKINVPFMELVEIADDSIVDRFVPEARLREHSTVYYSTGDLPEVDSSECDDVPFGNPPQGDVDKTVKHKCELEKSKMMSEMIVSTTTTSSPEACVGKTVPSLNDPPKLDNWLDNVVTGETYQKPEEWEELQRRLRSTGNSDDLTWLQNFVAVKFDSKASSMETTTGCTTASMGTGITTIGQKRNAWNYHENDNHQDNPINHVDNDETKKQKINSTFQGRLGKRSSINHVDDDETMKKKMNSTFQGRLRKRRAEVFGDDAIRTAKRKHVRDLTSTLYKIDCNQNFLTNRNDGPTSGPAETPQKSGEETSDGYRNLCRHPIRLAPAVHYSLPSYHTTVSRTNFLESSSDDCCSRKDSPPTVQRKLEETLPANDVETTLKKKSLPPPLVESPKSVYAASLPKDHTKPGNGVITSHTEKNQHATTTNATTMNNISQDYSDDEALDSQEASVTTDNDTTTSSPAGERKEVPLLSHPKDAAHTATAVSTESKETPPVMEDSSSSSQDQKEEEEEVAVAVAHSSSMIISGVENTTTPVEVIPQVQSLYKGHFQNLMITMAIWSISLIVFLWALVGRTDHQLWRANEPFKKPLRFRLSMETIYPPSVHTLATVTESNPQYEPWLGREKGGDTSLSSTIMSLSNSSGIHLHRRCSPWYGVMSLTFGVLVIIWILTKLLKKRRR